MSECTDDMPREIWINVIGITFRLIFYKSRARLSSRESFFTPQQALILSISLKLRLLRNIYQVVAFVRQHKRFLPRPI